MTVDYLREAFEVLWWEYHDAYINDDVPPKPDEADWHAEQYDLIATGQRQALASDMRFASLQRAAKLFVVARDQGLDAAMLCKLTMD